MEIGKILKKLGIGTLALYGAIGLAGKGCSVLYKNVIPNYREAEGRLESGLKYNIKTQPNPNSSGSYEYATEFGDSVTVEDAFGDGWIGPYDILDKDGERLINSEQNQNNIVAHSLHMRIDDKLHEDVLNRIREVYKQQNITVKEVTSDLK